jgi:hypothetical protein
MAKPTAADWQRLANLKKNNARKVAELRALRLGSGKRGDALRLQKSIAEAARLEKELNKRDGRK